MAGAGRCHHDAGKDRRMSNPDKVVDLIEERGPMSAAQIGRAI
jgi:hypothetical protein